MTNFSIFVCRQPAVRARGATAGIGSFDRGKCQDVSSAVSLSSSRDCARAELTAEHVFRGYNDAGT